MAATRRVYSGAQWLAHRVGVRVLDRHQTADRLVRVGWVAERGLDGIEVHRAVRVVLERTDARPDDHRMPGGLVDDEVVFAAADRFLAAAEVRELGDQVAHRARRDEQPGLLAEQLGGAILEGVDGRVVAEDVVADFGVGHHPPHRRGRLGHRIASEIDEGHEL